MQTITDEYGYYHTPARQVFFLARWLPSLFYYPQFVYQILKYSRLAKQGKFGEEEWQRSSQVSTLALETVGVELEITGVDNFASMTGPCVFVANHMSTLETIALPGLIQPYKDCIFILKRGMVEYPVFKHIMLARNPIVVDRENPREDLKVVLEEGSNAIARGRSIIVFPQTTRTLQFDPEQFNTIGVKLAKRANVPVVPVAVQTDAWGIGSIIKELARIDPSKKVHIAFGEPIPINGRGADEHKQVIEFIQQKLQSWHYPLAGQAAPTNMSK
ncbi:lysophospholipid acyltransferase family protein [soil metagenome]